MWEVPALAVIVELYSRAVTADMGKFELQVLYARAMSRVWEKIERLRRLDGLKIADFGTRRRHGFLWQDWCVQAMIEGLGPSFLGTSNCLIALRREVEAIGTNAHELPMVYAALADDDAALARRPTTCWPTGSRTTTATCASCCPIRSAPEASSRMRRTGWRSGPACASIQAIPIATGEWVIDWWRRRGEDPAQKLFIFSDALDIADIERLHAPFPWPRPARLRLGHAADQRLPRSRSRRPARSVLDRLQGDLAPTAVRP